MRQLACDYIANRIDRRGFLKQMTACGYTLAAAESVAAVLAPLSTAAQSATRQFPIAEGTGSYLLVQQLKAAGVKHVFYGNGTSSASMLDAMAGDDDIHLILAPSENITTAMASGYALASNNPTFVNVHGTVGTAQQMLQMFNAKKDSVPLVVSSFTKSLESVGRDGFEAVDDLVEITKQFTRWSFEIPLAHRVPEILRNAIRISTLPPGGPTYLSLPQDVGQARGEAEIIPKEFFTVPVRTKPESRLVEQAAQRLLEAKKPFMVVGHEVWRCGAYDEVVQLAELVGMPVVQGFRPIPTFRPTIRCMWARMTDRSASERCTAPISSSISVRRWCIAREPSPSSQPSGA
jgi:thiamine pyrophosphate-dependent acetolactate synthase large subunit-like protein